MGAVSTTVRRLLPLAALLLALVITPATASAATLSGTRVSASGLAALLRTGPPSAVSPGGQPGIGPAYDGLVVGVRVATEATAGADQLPLFIETPGGLATQSLDPEALAARDAVLRGASVFKGGNVNSLAADQSQFFALESPETAGYAARYGIPPANLPFDWIAEGQIAPGADFITRAAPGVFPNLGGGIEVVAAPGSFVGGG